MRSFVFTSVVLLVAFAAKSATPDFPASDWEIINSIAKGWIKENPAGTEYWIGGARFDAKTGKLLGQIVVGGCGGAIWDKSGRAWLATPTGIKRLEAADTATYTISSNNLSSNNILAICGDEANNRIIAGCGYTSETYKGGISIISLDAAGNPVSSVNAFGDQAIHAVGSFGKIAWAINNQAVYRLCGNEQKKFDISNSPVVNVAGAFVNVDGRVFVACHANALPIKPYIAKYDEAKAEWETITLPENFDGCRILSLVVNDKNQLWISGKYLAWLDLATGNIDTAKLDGSVASWLDDKGVDWHPTLGLTNDSHLLIVGNGAFVRNISGNAVRWTVQPRIIRGNSEVIGFFDLLGRRIVNNNSFSSKSFSAGNYLTVIRTANGIRAEKSVSFK